MKRRLPALTARQVLRALERAGFFIQRTSGGHYILKHPRDQRLRVTVPVHSGDLKRRTIETIVEQSGIAVDEFLRLL